MATPTKSQVMDWKADALAQIAKDAGTIRDAIDTQADTMNRSIQGLDWSGDAYRAATDRADRERTQQRAVATGYDDLASALTSAANDMGSAINQIQQTVNGLPQTWTVTEDFTVTPPHGADASEMNAAANDTNSLKNLATHLGQVMNKWAPRISSAVTEISQMAPVSAEKCVVNPADQFTPQQARADLQALRGGTANADTLARLRTATDLSPDEKNALANGKNINLPQFGYLQALSKGMNGMDGDDITNLGSKLSGNGHDQAQAAVADGLRIVSDPQVHAAGLDGKPDAVGGMNQLPDTVQNALKDKPVTSIPFGSHDVSNWNNLRAINTLMSNGDKTIQGSDINRGMIKQGAELAAASNPSTYFDVGTDNVDKLSNGLLDNASGDHAAVHDAIVADPNSTNPDARAAADRMNVTCDNGGKYFGSQHMIGVLQHQWTPDQHGAENMVKWIGTDASQPKGGFVNNEAGQSAYGLAAILGDPNNQHTLNSPDNPMGVYNPGLTRTLANTMSPYLGNLAGITDQDLLNSVPVDSTGQPLALPFHNSGDMSNVFSVLDSDPEAARTINSAGMQWHDAIQYASGLDTNKAPGLLMNAHHLQQAMDTGLTTEINQHAAERAYQAGQHYANEGVYADGVTSAVQTVGAFTGPVGSPIIGGVAATVDSYIKADVIPNPADPAHPLADDKVSTELNSIQSSIRPDSTRDEYLQTEGYVEKNPGAAQYFNQPGQANALDWHNIANSDGSGMNAWQDDYSRFRHDTNNSLDNDIFPAPPPQNNTEITEPDITPQGNQKPPEAAK